MLLSEAKQILKKNGYRLVEDTDELDDADLPVGVNPKDYHDHKRKMMSLNRKSLKKASSVENQKLRNNAYEDGIKIIERIEEEFANDFEIKQMTNNVENLLAYKITVEGRKQPIVLSLNVPWDEKDYGGITAEVRNASLGGAFLNSAGTLYGEFTGSPEIVEEKLVSLFYQLKSQDWKGRTR